MNFQFALTNQIQIVYLLHFEWLNTAVYIFLCRAPVVRTQTNKFYVAKHEYGPSIFPDYASGTGYLISGSAIHDLYTTALQENYFKLEDVFITGIVAELANVKRIHSRKFLYYYISADPCTLRTTICVHKIKPKEQYTFWGSLMDTDITCGKV